MAIRFKGRTNFDILGISKSGTVTGAAGAATLNTSSGTITTESLTTAAGATFTLTLTNSYIAAADIVLVTVSSTGTGSPAVTEVTPAAGTCVVLIQNVHASAAFNAVLIVKFVVIKQ
jgi:hypothetical protein